MNKGKKIYHCKECGWVTDAEPKGAIGKAHAHAEKHTKVLPFIPAGLFASANPNKLDSVIEKVKIRQFDYGNTPVEAETR